jgi:cbb3-type cytochrome oxidase subunit 1
VIPRFAGHPLRSRRVAVVHWWISNAGLAAMACGFAWRVWQPVSGTWLLASGGTLSALGAYLFAWEIWRTIDGVKASHALQYAGKAAMK